MAKLASTRYAGALFSHAGDSDDAEGALRQLSDEARLVVEILDENDELRRFLAHPHITEAEKVQVFENILRGRVSEALLGLVVLIVRKRRESIMRDVLGEFVRLVDEHNNVAKAIVTSAVPIDEARLDIIRNILCEKFGKNIILEANVDKTQVGGFKVLTLGYSFDRTIKAYINELQTKI